MIVYDEQIKNQRLQVVIDELDTAGAPYMVIATAGMVTELARVTLASPPFTRPAAGVMQLRQVPRIDADAKADGDAAMAAIYDGNGRARVTGLTVGPVKSGKDIEISTVRIVQHQRVEVTSGMITHG